MIRTLVDGTNDAHFDYSDFLQTVCPADTLTNSNTLCALWRLLLFLPEPQKICSLLPSQYFKTLQQSIHSIFDDAEDVAVIPPMLIYRSLPHLIASNSALFQPVFLALLTPSSSLEHFQVIAESVEQHLATPSVESFLGMIDRTDIGTYSSKAFLLRSAVFVMHELNSSVVSLESLLTLSPSLPNAPPSLNTLSEVHSIWFLVTSLTAPIKKTFDDPKTLSTLPSIFPSPTCPITRHLLFLVRHSDFVISMLEMFRDNCSQWSPSFEYPSLFDDLMGQCLFLVLVIVSLHLLVMSRQPPSEDTDEWNDDEEDDKAVSKELDAILSELADLPRFVQKEEAFIRQTLNCAVTISSSFTDHLKNVRQQTKPSSSTMPRRLESFHQNERRASAEWLGTAVDVLLSDVLGSICTRNTAIPRSDLAGILTEPQFDFLALLQISTTDVCCVDVISKEEGSQGTLKQFIEHLNAQLNTQLSLSEQTVVKCVFNSLRRDHSDDRVSSLLSVLSVLKGQTEKCDLKVLHTFFALVIKTARQNDVPNHIQILPFLVSVLTRMLFLSSSLDVESSLDLIVTLIFSLTDIILDELAPSSPKALNPSVQTLFVASVSLSLAVLSIQTHPLSPVLFLHLLRFILTAASSFFTSSQKISPADDENMMNLSTVISVTVAHFLPILWTAFPLETNTVHTDSSFLSSFPRIHQPFLTSPQMIKASLTLNTQTQSIHQIIAKLSNDASPLTATLEWLLSASSLLFSEPILKRYSQSPIVLMQNGLEHLLSSFQTAPKVKKRTVQLLSLPTLVSHILNQIPLFRKHSGSPSWKLFQVSLYYISRRFALFIQTMSTLDSIRFSVIPRKKDGDTQTQSTLTDLKHLTSSQFFSEFGTQESKPERRMIKTKTVISSLCFCQRSSDLLSPSGQIEATALLQSIVRVLEQRREETPENRKRNLLNVTVSVVLASTFLLDTLLELNPSIFLTVIALAPPSSQFAILHPQQSHTLLSSTIHTLLRLFTSSMSQTTIQDNSGTLLVDLVNQSSSPSFSACSESITKRFLESAIRHVFEEGAADVVSGLCEYWISGGTAGATLWKQFATKIQRKVEWYGDVSEPVGRFVSVIKTRDPDCEQSPKSQSLRLEIVDWCVEHFTFTLTPALFGNGTMWSGVEVCLNPTLPILDHLLRSEDNYSAISTISSLLRMVSLLFKSCLQKGDMLGYARGSGISVLSRFVEWIGTMFKQEVNERRIHGTSTALPDSTPSLTPTKTKRTSSWQPVLLKGSGSPIDHPLFVLVADLIDSLCDVVTGIQNGTIAKSVHYISLRELTGWGLVSNAENGFVNGVKSISESLTFHEGGKEKMNAWQRRLTLVERVTLYGRR
ncbi:hypothetical protein BLNAU_4658 [Blattamonas nauphoetae]|uniref:Nucleolar 27S pre-rRNA processing Urb2/Npa2 C-terminal domain-containing protein n=1 Tax=Blattamonas nauphoetae TaxID=2049346 RepID=A0ABQ9Y9R9_9EUKA|nr:hypothetical protein BLNAU_4658 [Blattamonas nauphoetae]